jgi:DNA-binding CsgD family transcriptional regulator
LGVVKVSATSTRDIFRLIGDVRESERLDPAWRREMLIRLSSFVGADAGLACASSSPLRYPPRPQADSVVFGWTLDEQARWIALDQRLSSMEPCLTVGDERGTPQVTAARRQLVDDRVWYEAPYVTRVLHSFGVDDNLVSVYRVGSTSRWEAVALFRSRDQRPFTDVDVELIHLFHQEMGRLWDRDARARMALSPREEEVLRGLMNGLSEKELAAKFGLSQHTVHHYVKALHKAFAVQNRGGLIAAAWGRVSQRE